MEAGVPWQTLQPPHLSFTLVPSTDTGPLRVLQTCLEQTLVAHFPLLLLPSLFSPSPPYPSDLICPTKLHPLPLIPGFFPWSVCFLHSCRTTWPCGLKSYKTPVALSRWTAFPLFSSAWHSWQINLDWIVFFHRVPEVLKLSAQE